MTTCALLILYIYFVSSNSTVQHHSYVVAKAQDFSRVLSARVFDFKPDLPRRLFELAALVLALVLAFLFDREFVLF